MSKANAKNDRKLYDAVKSNDANLVREMLDQGANPNAPVGKKGMTCMERALTCSNKEIEQMLANSGGVLHKNSVLRKKAEEDGDIAPLEEPSSKHPQPVPVTMSKLASGAGSSLQVRAQRASSSSGKPKDWSSAVEPEAAAAKSKDWEFDRSKLKQVKKLGEGTFGIVFEGLASGIVPGEKETRVAVKMLQSEKEDQLTSDFFKEVHIMKSIDGPHNVVRLLGVCTKEEPYLMIMELMPRGDLKTVLRDSRPKESQASQFSFSDLARMGADIAEGMAYLTEVKIVHRDLAARNCLVGEKYNVKIGDFGLTRDVYQGEYYRMTGSAPMPIRWMSPEAIMDGVYTHSSDIWSFGVVLWEIFTFAKMPYAGLSNMEVCEKVTEEGFRLAIPKGCPPELFAVAQKCWKEEPEDRGTFAELTKWLAKLAESLPKAPIGKSEGGKGKSSDDISPTRRQPEDEPEESTEYQHPQDSLSYQKARDKDDVDNQKLYSDNRFSGKPSMAVALEVATEKQEVQEPHMMSPGDRSGSLVQKLAKEHFKDSAPAEPPKPQPSGKVLPKYGGAKSGFTSNVPSRFSSEKSPRPIAVQTLPPGSKMEKPPTTTLSPTKADRRASDEPSPAERRQSTAIRKPSEPVVESKLHLANDKTETALKAQAANEALAVKAEKDIIQWIEAVIGDYLPSDLQTSLKSGEILCHVMNKIAPGTIDKVHENSRMAFKQMENIGRFLDACKDFGVLESDVFMTIDLFESANMKQVIICLSALRKRAEMLGFKV